MPTLITYPVLLSICSEFQTNINAFDLEMGVLTNCIYGTGLRFSEVYELDRWQVIDMNILEVQTKKGSDARLFQNSELPPEFVWIIRNDAQYFRSFSYKTYTNYFTRFFRYPFIYTGNKQISSHIFRHLRAKQLNFEGQTDEQIRVYLGERDIKNAQSYINSEIYIP
jgi:site-specific recombinase XerD